MSISHPIPQIRLFQNLTLKIQGQGHGRSEHWKLQHGSNILSTHIPFIPCQSAILSIILQLFQNLTLTIQVQGHGWGEHWKSQHGSNILSTHIPFIPCQSSIPFLVRLFQNLTLKIQGQSHGWGQSWKSQSGCIILLTHIPFIPCQSALPFLRYCIFKIWPWKSKVKVIGEGNLESHNMGPTFYRLTPLSFHVNRPSHSWDTTFSKFDIENPNSRSWLRSKLKVTKWV